MLDWLESLPEGFELAPADRVPEQNEKKVGKHIT
jgi:hypothetical protein